jgi:CRP-like cAMP-binding protein
MSGQSIHDKNLFDQLPASLNLQLDLSLKRELIEGVPMFKTISPLSVLAIIRKLTHTIAIPDEIIMRQGEVGDCMYFLMRGQVSVYLELGGREKEHLTTMSDGAVFGEIALVHPDKPRTATVSALGFCEMQELNAVDFDEMLQVHLLFTLRHTRPIHTQTHSSYPHSDTLVLSALRHTRPIHTQTHSSYPHSDTRPSAMRVTSVDCVGFCVDYDDATHVLFYRRYIQTYSAM